MTIRPVGDVTVSFCVLGARRCRMPNPSDEDREVHRLETVLPEYHRHKGKVLEWKLVVERGENILEARKGANGLTTGQLVQDYPAV